MRFDSVVWAVELAHWLRLAGAPVPAGDLAASTHPYAASARGDWAAAAWSAAGYPYEAAAALSCADEEETVLAGLVGLDALGGVALAARVRADLRRRGVAHVPRGPAASTRDNVAGLTARQLEVLDLLATGLSSPATAARLVLSVRADDHHAADLMRKLGAATRTEAPERAARLGWAPPATDS